MIFVAISQIEDSPWFEVGRGESPGEAAQAGRRCIAVWGVNQSAAQQADERHELCLNLEVVTHADAVASGVIFTAVSVPAPLFPAMAWYRRHASIAPSTALAEVEAEADFFGLDFDTIVDGLLLSAEREMT